MAIPTYLEKLERSLIDYLGELGIKSEPGAHGLTGVWSMARSWRPSGSSSTVGGQPRFALNPHTELDYFDGIIPSDTSTRRPTSVRPFTGQRIDN